MDSCRKGREYWGEERRNGGMIEGTWEKGGKGAGVGKGEE